MIAAQRAALEVLENLVEPIEDYVGKIRTDGFSLSWFSRPSEPPS
jgi:hypothetical protein